MPNFVLNLGSGVFVGRGRLDFLLNRTSLPKEMIGHVDEFFRIQVRQRRTQCDFVGKD
jgi:hypothetical protein